MTLQPQNPRKVLHKAQELGVHNDCVVAGVAGCCPECFDTMMLAYDFFYGHLPREEAMDAIVADMMSDREAEFDA